jgi:hypothetical protein
MVDIDPNNGASERTTGVKGPFQNGTDNRPEREAVVRRYKMDRRAHEGDTHRLAVADEPGEIVWIKAIDPAPKTVVRVDGLLRLHSDQSFEGFYDRQLPPPEEHLSLK